MNRLAGLAGVVDADVRGADFAAAGLERATFQRSDMRTPVFDEANMGEANLRDAPTDAASFVETEWNDTVCPEGVNSGGETYEGHL